VYQPCLFATKRHPAGSWHSTEALAVPSSSPLTVEAQINLRLSYSTVCLVQRRFWVSSAQVITEDRPILCCTSVKQFRPEWGPFIWVAASFHRSVLPTCQQKHLRGRKLRRHVRRKRERVLLTEKVYFSAYQDQRSRACPHQRVTHLDSECLDFNVVDHCGLESLRPFEIWCSTSRGSISFA
jgi:hypothetical protein